MTKYFVQSLIKRTKDMGLMLDGVSLHKTKQNLKEYLREMEENGDEVTRHGTLTTVEMDGYEEMYRVRQDDMAEFKKEHEIKS